MRRSLFTIALALAFASLGAPVAVQASASEEIPQTANPLVVPLPETDLSRMEASVRQRLTDAYQRVREAATDTPNVVLLGQLYGELGTLALTLGIDPLAEAALANAQNLDPANPGWPCFAGMLFEKNQKFDAAAESLLACLRKNPQDHAARLRLGRTYASAGQEADARRLFELVLETEEDSEIGALAHYQLGRLDLSAKDYQAAISHLETALQRQPEAAEVHQQLGLAYRRAGLEAKARVQLTHPATGTLALPDPRLAEAVASIEGGHVFAGMQAAQQGRYEEAAEHYRKAIQGDPANPSYRKALGAMEHRLGNLSAAQAEYREAIRLDPSDAMGRLRLSSLVQEAGGPQSEVLSLLEQGAQSAPDLPEVRLALARALVDAGRREEAAPHFAAGLTEGDARPEDRLQYARLLLNAGQPTQAAQELELVLAEQPENDQALLALGRTRVRQGKPQEARGLYQQVLASATDPRTQALAHVRLARLSEADQDLEAALGHYRESFRRAPRYLDGVAGLARILVLTEQFEQAIEPLAQTVRLQPQQTGPRLRLAQALMATGQFGEARTALEAGRKELPESGELAQALARLLATCSSPQIRDGEQALGLASALHRSAPSFDSAVTLGMALAAAGQFDQAASVQEQILAQAEKGGAPGPLVQRLKTDLQRYRGGEIALP